MIWFGEDFFSQTSGEKPLMKDFFLHTTVRELFSIISHGRYFFQCKNVFLPGISLKEIFSLKMSMQDIFL